MNISFSLDRLAREIGGSVIGDGSLKIMGIAPLDTAKEGDLTFVTNPRYLKAAEDTGATAILCEKEIKHVHKSFLLTTNPYVSLAKVIALFHPAPVLSPGIRNGAWVDSQSSVHPQASILAGATVSAGAKVGARTILYPGVFIGENTVIGEDCIFYPNVTIRENCIIGNRVILQPGAVVGADGFGFAKDGELYHKIPQVGNVVIENDVELGANTCIDRAVLGTTLIGRGTKLDNLIQIGHNVVVGENTVMAALTGISGSTHIGSRVIIGGQVGLAGHLKIGDDVTLATRTGVMEDIPEKGVYFGSPSTEFGTEMKRIAANKQLPELIKRVRNLEKALDEVKNMKKNENKANP
jgi:UDP-3-O-[3-hydroxymyristoyl] glucosamine N-acyltransferase